MVLAYFNFFISSWKYSFTYFKSYISRYGAELKSPSEMPQFVKDISPPEGLVLASEAGELGLGELEGDVEALALVDLDAEGLSEYSQFVQQHLRSRATIGLASANNQTPSIGNTPSTVVSAFSRPSIVVGDAPTVLRTASVMTASAQACTPSK